MPDLATEPTAEPTATGALDDAFRAWLATPDWADAFLAWLTGPDQRWRWYVIARHIPTLLELTAPQLSDAPPKPPAVTFVPLREEFAPMSRIIGRVPLPPPGAPDVDKRELELVVAGGGPEIMDVTGGPPEIGVTKGESFTLRFRETDRDGNVGEWSDPGEFVAHDVFAPPKPSGTLMFEPLREEFDPGELGPAEGEPAPGGEPVPMPVPAGEDLEPGETSADVPGEPF